MISLQELRENNETFKPIDRLEEHAAFLSSFQNYYTPSSTKFGTIEPQEIAQVLEYRDICDKLQELQEDAALFDRCSVVVRNHNNDDYHDDTDKQAEHLNPYQDDIDACRAQIALLEANKRLLHLDLLLERFQIWSVKALVQHLLMSHDFKRLSETDAICWSMLLQLPSASYMCSRLAPTKACRAKQKEMQKKQQQQSPQQQYAFAKLWDELYNHHDHLTTATQPHICNILLPPNIHNHEEYARLTHMVAQLPTEAAINASHCSAFCGKLTHTTCSTKYYVRPHELVALWMRAQHNSSAMRQLINLFIIDEEPQRDDDNATTVRYRATLAGNHRLAYRKAALESPSIDRMAAYAVMNQTLLTRPKIIQAWKEENHAKQGPTQRPAKRLRFTNQDDALTEQERINLRRACQCHLLYRMADKHRTAVQPAFYSKAKHLANVFQTRRKKLVATDGDNDECLQKALQLMKRLNRHRSHLGQNRTIVRIARRLWQGCFDNEDDARGCTGIYDAFYTAVHQLLQMIWKYAPSVVNNAPRVTREKEAMYQLAIDDWKTSYSEFTKEKDRYGVVVAARHLLDKDGCDWDIGATSLADRLRNRPVPWFEKCSAKSCSEPTAVLYNSKFRVCAVCDKAVHASCCGQDGWCDAFDRAQSRWKMKPPEANRAPDYRGARASEVKWTMKPFKSLQRTMRNGSLEPYGFSFVNLDECSSVLDRVLSGKCFIENLRSAMTCVAYEQKGMLVTDIVPGGLAERRGLCVGDVIVSVTSSSNIIRHDDQSSGSSTNFANMSEEQRSDRMHMHARTTEMSMIVNRPNQELLDKNQAWYKELADANTELAGAWELEKDCWYCRECRATETELDIVADERDTLCRLDSAMRSFESCASLVGKSILVLPEDPLIREIKEELRKNKVKLHIEHLGRPIELVILAFLPAMMEMEAHSGMASSGIFFLLPIISQHQLNYLAPRCKPRQVFAGTADARTLNAWAKDGLLDLAGIMKKPLAFIQRMLAQTRCIQEAISKKVSSLARCMCVYSFETDDDIESSRLKPHFPCACGVAKEEECFRHDASAKSFKPDHIVDDMLTSRVPPVLCMLRDDCEAHHALSDIEAFDAAASVESRTGRQKVQHSHPHHECMILFSDIRADKGGLNNFTDPRYQSNLSNECKHVVLQYEAGLCDYWGFEIVQWKNDLDRVRIGRLQTNSPAQRAGLVENAVLLSINGKSGQSLARDGLALSCALRGVPVTASTESVATERRNVLHIQVPAQHKSTTGTGPVRSMILTAEDCMEIGMPASSLKIVDARMAGMSSHTKPSKEHEIKASETGSTNNNLLRTAAARPKLELLYPKHIYAGQLELWYSDLCSIARKERLIPPHDQYLATLSDPRASAVVMGPLRNIAVTKSVNSQKYCGVLGWGFELVRWQGDKEAWRIGRMNTESDAYKAGVRPNDVIIAINDYVLKSFRCSGKLAAMVLGISYQESWQHYKHIMHGIAGGEIPPPAASRLLLSIRQPSESRSLAPAPVLPQEIAEPAALPPARVDSRAKALTTKSLDIIDLTDKDVHNNECEAASVEIARASYRRFEPPHTRLHNMSAAIALIQEATPLQEQTRNSRLICLDDVTSTAWNHHVSFTLVEMALLLQLCRDGSVLLAARMLMPRYHIDQITAHVKYLAGLTDEHLQSIPSLPPSLLNYILERDRMRMEADGVTGGDDILLVKTDFSLATHMRRFFDVATAMRLRGGGPTELVDLDRSLWHGEIVSGLCRLSEDDEVKGKCVYIGIVDCRTSLLLSDSDEVDVWVFYLSERGIVDPIWLRIPVEGVSVVAIGSSEEKIVKKWIATNAHRNDRLPRGRSIDRFLPDTEVAENTTRLGHVSSVPDLVDRESRSQTGTPVLGEASTEQLATPLALNPDAANESEVATVAAVVADDSGEELSDFEPTARRSVRHCEGYTCKTCNLGTERVLTMDDDDDDDEPGAEKKDLYCGTGCSLSLLGMCRNGVPPADVSCGNIVKDTLLQLASMIPRSCRSTNTSNLAGVNILDEHMWRHFDDWKEFVIESRTLESLCQAFVVLLSSVHLDSFPPWYNDGGACWSSPPIVLQLPSKAALLLHMQVFDAALAERDVELCRPFQNPPAETISSPEEYAVVAALAVEVGKADDWSQALEHNFYCIECEEGGDMLCCEFCSNVCHSLCCRPPLEQEPEYYVCRSCLADLQPLIKSWSTTRRPSNVAV